MTNKLEELKEVIQLANPEIMELKRGCLLATEDGLGYYNEDFEISYVHKGTKHEVMYFKSNEFGRKEVNEVNFEILGRPITLSDILIALHKKWLNGAGFSLELKQRDLIRIWNLKETLDNQSEETISFLYELLVTRNT